MGWWFSGGGGSSVAESANKNQSSSGRINSEVDAWVPPPPAGTTVPPPPPPSGASAKVSSQNFTGFSPPPVSSTPSSVSSTTFPLPFSTPKTNDYYEKEDFSKYASSSAPETPGFYDRQYIEDERRQRSGSSLLDRYVTNPRMRACLEGVKMGMKMGAAVGGIFGVLTGSYAALVNRNFWIVPISAVGGAVSFGFFLGCGMIVRCDEEERRSFLSRNNVNAASGFSAASVSSPTTAPNTSARFPTTAAGGTPASRAVSALSPALLPLRRFSSSHRNFC